MLYFQETSVADGGDASIGARSSINMVLTAAEAAEYQLGFVYDLTLSVE
jgi:hypothetical protein